ncbi:hypothetical protein Acr_00g0080660 [Actinidia rufa]|uniref:Uncharacterized protein n=1 Tax=Actinidia rufa TaxID=165716 RepID=A0A7J0DU98_9ERIC|nr:hypothetical protein Acr_00g0080660 [Actinidia rufa]
MEDPLFLSPISISPFLAFFFHSLETMAYTNLNLNLNICPRDNIDETRRSVLMQELNQRRTENKKLTEMLFFLSENYNSLQEQLMDFKLEDDQSKLKKRKAEGENCCVLGINGNSESSSCSDGGSWKMPREIKTDVSRVHVKTDPSDTSLVQRSVEDPWVVVAIYEGEHHHHHPCQADRLPLGLNQGVISSPKSTISSSPSPILDSMQPESCIDARRPNLGIDMPAFQELLVEKMANSLTRNHSFRAALAAAISTRILDHDLLFCGERNEVNIGFRITILTCKNEDRAMPISVRANIQLNR